MASVWPTSIDTFANPIYLKVDGEDIVKASHVVDLQDAVVAIEEVVAGAGKPLNFASNRFIADDSSFKSVVEALDSEAGSIRDDFTAHKAFVLPTDPVQHHSNVIEVTSIGNLSSVNVQNALQEHQSDIDAIMSGGTVDGANLDNRYVNLSGSQTMQGPLAITESLSVNGAVILGDDISDTVTISGELTAVGVASVNDSLTVGSNILLQAGSKIAEQGATNASYLLFDTDKLELYSHKDFIVRIDADDATDGLSEDAKFSIYNGLGAEVFSVDETGDLTIGGNATSNEWSSLTKLNIGASSSLEIYDNKADFDSDEYHIQLDKNDTSATARLYVTMDGDTGNNLASPDLLLNLDESATLVTGVHKLRSGIQETGYFGMRTFSDNAGGVFYGQGVNFKTQLTNSPSSITLTVDENVNASNISVVHMNEYGFFYEFDSVAVGAVKVRGTYTTVGN